MSLVATDKPAEGMDLLKGIRRVRGATSPPCSERTYVEGGGSTVSVTRTASHDDLAAELTSLWNQLELEGATVHRVPLDVPARVLKQRITWAARRLRALNERGGRGHRALSIPPSLAWLDLDAIPAEPRDGWAADGVCTGRRHTDVFYPDSELEENYDPARAICAICPARYDCLAQALATTQDHGCWGGTSPHQRRKIRKALQRRRAA